MGSPTPDLWPRDQSGELEQLSLVRFVFESEGERGTGSVSPPHPSTPSPAFFHYPYIFRQTPYGRCRMTAAAPFGTWARDGRYNTIHISHRQILRGTLHTAGLTDRIWRWPTPDQRSVMPYFTRRRWRVYVSLTPPNQLHMAWNSLISKKSLLYRLG